MMTAHSDLLKLVESADRFATVVFPTPSHFEDSAQRFDVEWKNVRKELSDTWDADDVASMDDAVSGLAHDGGAAVVLVQGRGCNAAFIEFLLEGVERAVVHSDRLPRLATIIEGRQRSIPHVVVETDRTGADLTAFAGGGVVSTEQVHGETLHIHRSAPGGRSQRRFQQRAQNTWEDNGGEVADAVADLARSVDARLIVIAGDTRSRALVFDALPTDLADITNLIEEGSPDGVADHVVRLLSNDVAERVVGLAESVRAGVSSGQASTETDAILDALVQGRVDTLLVDDDDLDEPVLTEDLAGIPGRYPDRRRSDREWPEHRRIDRRGPRPRHDVGPDRCDDALVTTALGPGCAPSPTTIAPVTIEAVLRTDDAVEIVSFARDPYYWTTLDDDPEQSSTAHGPRRSSTLHMAGHMVGHLASSTLVPHTGRRYSPGLNGTRRWRCPSGSGGSTR